MPIVSDPENIPLYGDHMDPEVMRMRKLQPGASGLEPVCMVMLAWHGGQLLGDQSGWMSVVKPFLTKKSINEHGAAHETHHHPWQPGSISDQPGG
jgi:hypothetical protein